MSMINYVGVIILVGVFVGVFTAISLAEDIRAAIIVSTGAILLTAIVCLGCYLACK